MAIRLLLARIGIDGHDRGVRTVALALRDAGIEVIYTGPWQSIESVTETAIQEDVDVIGISTLGGDYLLIPKLLDHMKKRGLNIPLILGGIIPADVEQDLKRMGVAAIFHPGASTEDIVKTIDSLAKPVAR